MNKTLLISIIFIALFLFHGVVYASAWVQCGSGANEVGRGGKRV